MHLVAKPNPDAGWWSASFTFDFLSEAFRWTHDLVCSDMFEKGSITARYSNAPGCCCWIGFTGDLTVNSWLNLWDFPARPWQPAQRKWTQRYKHTETRPTPGDTRPNYLLFKCRDCVSQGMAAAQPKCDPETQYPNHGECCVMCEPGTKTHASRMHS